MPKAPSVPESTRWWRCREMPLQHIAANRVWASLVAMRNLDHNTVRTSMLKLAKHADVTRNTAATTVLRLVESEHLKQIGRDLYLVNWYFCWGPGGTQKELPRLRDRWDNAKPWTGKPK